MVFIPKSERNKTKQAPPKSPDEIRKTLKQIRHMCDRVETELSGADESRATTNDSNPVPFTRRLAPEVVREVIDANMREDVPPPPAEARLEEPPPEPLGSVFVDVFP